MKKFLVCILCLLAILVQPTALLSYSQQQSVVRVVKDGVMLYKNPSAVQANELFTLVKGYFALASDYNEQFYEVTYQFTENNYVPILGYLKKEDAELYDGVRPDLVYPDFSATALKSTLIYESCEGKEAIGAMVKDQIVKCYGFRICNDETFVYARQGNIFGYISCSNLLISEIPEHPIPLPKDPGDEPADPDGDDPGTAKPKDDKLQILLILAIVIPSLVIIWVMLRPKKKRF